MRLRVWSAAGDGKPVRQPGGNHEQITGAGATAPAGDGLNTFPGEVENQLGEIVAVGCDLGVAVTVVLKFTQHESQRVDFDFLNEEWAPGEHEVGGVLAKVGNVLTQAAVSAYTRGPQFLNVSPKSREK